MVATEVKSNFTIEYFHFLWMLYFSTKPHGNMQTNYGKARDNESGFAGFNFSLLFSCNCLFNLLRSKLSKATKFIGSKFFEQYNKNNGFKFSHCWELVRELQINTESNASLSRSLEWRQALIACLILIRADCAILLWEKKSFVFRKVHYFKTCYHVTWIIISRALGFYCVWRGGGCKWNRKF